MSRPELTGHASSFYNERESKKYDGSSRMVGIQREITHRAIELLKLDNPTTTSAIIIDGGGRPSLILDVGCGSGLSGQVLEEHGHVWVGCDISRDMLNMANERMEYKRGEVVSSSQKDDDDDDDGDDEDDDDGDDEDDNDSTTMKDDFNNNTTKNKTKRRQRNMDLPLPTGDLLHHDMGTGLPFRPATFDACISISALQWLCYSNTRDQMPKRRLIRFFSSLYTVLRRGARAVLQFYPETAEHAILISECAAKVGFAGGIVVDYPNSTKAKKHYLVLSFERAYKAPPGLLTGSDGSTARTGVASGGVRVADIDNSSRAGGGSGGGGAGGRGKRGTEKNMIPRKKKGGGKTKEWIVHKKETQRKKGKDTRKDTKYTGRKRPMRF